MKSSGLQEQQEMEIIKAVAQAWLGHSNFPNPANEFDTRIAKFKARPSRFKAEANTRRGRASGGGGGWDFKHSLWDPYEIVAVSKRLEDGMVVVDREFLDPYCPRSSPKRRRESKNSLRSLFSQLSLNRFD
uniref:Uncharacterized protein n=1 Tax=Kalanchoe fedtschenkoi TaxID=63787 RepID=A0A7N0V9C3_KALFE